MMMPTRPEAHDERPPEALEDMAPERRFLHEATERSGFAAAITSAATMLRMATGSLADRAVVLAYHGDADGLCATRCFFEALAPFARQIVPATLEKGEHIQSPSYLARLAQMRPGLLLILDMGSRSDLSLPGVPTLLVDHHRPEGFPHGAYVVSSYGRSPPEPASLLAFLVGSELTPLSHLDWVAAVGTVADLGVRVPFPVVRDALRRYARQTISTVAALLNAAKRSAEHDVATALEALCLARSPKEIVDGASPPARRLHEYRREVNAEIRRWSRVAPAIANGVALIVVRSGAQVHPLLAARWARRLRPNVVVVANLGYRPDWVHFAVRSDQPRNLLDFLAPARAVVREGDVGYGHDRATGGVVPTADFAALLAHWRFPSDVIARTVNPAS